MMKILVTGAAGFIGAYVCQALLKQGVSVIGLDNLNDYYDVSLKRNRLAHFTNHENFRFVCMDLSDRQTIAELFACEKFDRVIHLAAQAGVRYSLENPYAYADSNLVGMLSILEGCRQNKVQHLIYASSSSVYGANKKIPFSTKDNVDHPVSFYAATKKCNELMAHSYSHLYGIPTTGLRFFTVYGPWGRPDMAPFLFTKAILKGEPINVFNHGNMKRDFTYIDDIVEGIMRIQEKPPIVNPEWNHQDKSSSFAPYKIFNIGNNQPVKLMDFILAIEKSAGKQAVKNFLPMQAGDVPLTYADIDDLCMQTNFAPKIKIDEGVNRFVSWYKDYYNV